MCGIICDVNIHCISISISISSREARKGFAVLALDAQGRLLEGVVDTRLWLEGAVGGLSEGWVT
jgi:hypothetical protein